MNLLIFLCMLQTTHPELTTLRRLYTSAVIQKDSAARFTELLAPIRDSEAPVFRCYKGVASMVQAKYALSPLTKLSLFRKGKVLIEDAISTDTTNMEMRYLRLTIQDNLPAVLNYKTALEKDKKYLQDHVGEEKDNELKNVINTYLSK